jgi:hypothetical protein
MPIPLANPATPRRNFGSTETRAGRSSMAHDKPARAPWSGPVLLRSWHLCSLDAPSVAVVWSLSFAWAAGVRLPGWTPVLLALGTWAVYIGDRLLDAQKALHRGLSFSLRDRHFFHWRHRRTLLPLALIASAAALGIIVICMPPAFRERNSLLGFAAAAYFSGVHRPRRIRLPRITPLSKEFLVGVLFTIGCVLPALVRIPIRVSGSMPVGTVLVAGFFFAALAWLNCAAIQRWESGERSEIARMGCTLGCVGIAAAMALCLVDGRVAALMLAGSLSALLLALLDRRRKQMTPLALRACADVVLLTPLLLLLR